MDLVQCLLFLFFQKSQHKLGKDRKGCGLQITADFLIGNDSASVAVHNGHKGYVRLFGKANRSHRTRKEYEM